MIRPSDLRVEVDRDGHCATITVGGDIDIATIGSLETARQRALADNPTRLVIDLTSVGFVDSSGLKFLLETHRLSQQHRWELQLLRPAESTMGVFRLTGTDKRLPFLDGD
jgi:anti-sigma B factor antagonist